MSRADATARVNAALDAGHEPDAADLMVCDVEALTRAMRAQRDTYPMEAAMVDIALPRREAVAK